MTDHEIINQHHRLFDLSGDVSKSSLHLGLQCGRGWFPPIDQMCQRLQPLAEGTGLRIVSVKQDMGVLRVAYRGGNDVVRAAIEAGAIEAAHSCEMCGDPGVLGEVDGWWMVRCAACVSQMRRTLLHRLTTMVTNILRTQRVWRSQGRRSL